MQIKTTCLYQGIGGIRKKTLYKCQAMWLYTLDQIASSRPMYVFG